MRKAIVLGILLVCSTISVVPTHAAMCTVDNVPAATLLVPYFEVGLESSGTITTLFSVNNASAAPVLAHVTLWSNASVPIFDFDIYLSGYDIQTINVRDLLNGVLPATASNLSNQGEFSDPNINFTGCGTSPGSPPWYPDPAIEGAVLEHFRTSFTGQVSPLTGDCGGLSTGDPNRATGYITIDAVRECNFLFPADAGYFGAGGTGVATNDNVLWGDYFYVEPDESFAQGETLVHVEAEDNFEGGSNLYTFYGRYSNFDNREPLATTFGVRHFTNAVFNGGTDLIVWRDSTEASTSRFACGSAPSWFPLPTNQVVIFDEEENPIIAEGPLVSGVPTIDLETPFPLEAQRVTIGSSALPTPESHRAGWIYMNLNFPPDDPRNTFANEPQSAQAWVTAVYNAAGECSLAIDGQELDSACNPFVGEIPIIRIDP